MKVKTFLTSFKSIRPLWEQLLHASFMLSFPFGVSGNAKCVRFCMESIFFLINTGSWILALQGIPKLSRLKAVDIGPSIPRKLYLWINDLTEQINLFLFWLEICKKKKNAIVSSMFEQILLIEKPNNYTFAIYNTILMLMTSRTSQTLHSVRWTTSIFCQVFSQFQHRFDQSSAKDLLRVFVALLRFVKDNIFCYSTNIVCKFINIYLRFMFDAARQGWHVVKGRLKKETSRWICETVFRFQFYEAIKFQIEMKGVKFGQENWKYWLSLTVDI